ncbi:MAG: isoleucine--tRNA ligase [Actinomycetes bacterium]
MPFEPLPPFDLVALERSVLEQWQDGDVFAESLRRRSDAPEWVFYEGPPTANGRPGLHHAWARLFKDIYPRFQTMRGHLVRRQGGWDCHGLPVEVEVEKELGFSGKQQIEAFGIAEFNARCRASVQRYVDDFAALTERIGMWLDVDGAYWTMSPTFVESVWWVFKRLWDQGDIYEGFKVVPYCGRCGTALSSHELGQPGAYRDITEDSVYVRFPVRDREFDLLVWTTTPWTLLSNVGVALGPDVEYARVRGRDGARDLVLAADRVAPVCGEDAEVVARVAATDLVGLHYVRPFEDVPLDDETACRVVAADFVTVEDGSGLVHLAPAFGEVDREVGLTEGLPVVNPVGPDAAFTSAVPAHAGTFVKEADAAIIERLRADGRLERVAAYEHSYPHCWRCSTPLIYWAKPTWFARTSAHRDAMIRENQQVGWHPAHIRDGRFGDWLENNVDWALSRDRFWGTPIPVWRCDGGHDTCVGSLAELSERAGSDLLALDPHRPDVDDVVIACPACGGPAHRVEPVLDAWFDSGSMPFAQLHYPFEQEDRFEQRFPADFICEGIDQTRGWFYTLLAINTMAFGRSPYRNVVCLALVVDKDGQKMSKSKGNVIAPFSVLDTRGADALRWNMFSAGSPWTPKRVFVEGIDETTNRFLLTLWNTCSFFVTYANLDGWEPGGAQAEPTHVLDRWIRSRLHHTVREVTDALEGFDALRGAQALDRLVDDLSNWYVRRSRPRFWRTADGAAHATLFECLDTVARLLAPYTPFTADALHQRLRRTSESVHLGDWPTVDDAALDPDLEAEVARARAVVSLGLAARNDARLKVRQPLHRAMVLLPDGGTLRPEVAEDVRDALNVGSLESVTSLEGLLDYTVHPNFRTLGPKVGPRVPALKAHLAEVDGAEVRRALEAVGTYRVVLDGAEVVLGPEDVEVRAASHEEFALAQEDGIAVALDTSLDDALRREGLARDLVRALNDLRKATGLEIADRIDLRMRAEGAVALAVREHGDRIAEEVLAPSWDLEEGAPTGAGGWQVLATDLGEVAVRIGPAAG